MSISVKKGWVNFRQTLCHNKIPHMMFITITPPLTTIIKIRHFTIHKIMLLQLLPQLPLQRMPSHAISSTHSTPTTRMRCVSLAMMMSITMFVNHKIKWATHCSVQAQMKVRNNTTTTTLRLAHCLVTAHMDIINPCHKIHYTLILIDYKTCLFHFILFFCSDFFYK